MNFSELQDALQKITGKKIPLSEFANVLGVGRANITDRNKRNSQVNTKEIELIQKAFNVVYFVCADDSNYKITDNSLERQNDTKVDEKSADFAKRLKELQKKHNFLDSEMAKLLEITPKDYENLYSGVQKLNLDILNRLKQNFKVSLDWLIYGE